MPRTLEPTAVAVRQEDIPLHAWLGGYRLVTERAGGVSAVELERALGLPSRRHALFVRRRLERLTRLHPALGQWAPAPTPKPVDDDAWREHVVDRPAAPLSERDAVIFDWYRPYME